MPVYRAKKTHVRHERFGNRVIEAYTTPVRTSEALDPSKSPFYFIPSGFNPVKAPVITDSEGKFTITCPGAEKICYTTDGSDPDGSDTVYASEVTLSATATVKAIGVYDDITTPVSSKQVTVSVIEG